MIIQTLKHQYAIVQKVRETNNFEQFLGWEESKRSDKKQYDIFRIKERELVVRLILVFMEQMGNRAFEDFYECFSKDGELYLVFVHQKADSLMEKLENESCILKERIIIGKKILERILLLNMPDMLVYDVLKSTGIQVTPALDVHFLYFLEEIDSFEKVTMEMVQSRLADIFSLLFTRELSLEISPDIPVFLEEIRSGEYNDYLGIYQAYLRLAEKLENQTAALRPNTFWFRVWEMIKNGFRRAKPIVITVLVLVLAAYLIYSILNPVPDQINRYDFQKIGTLSIVKDEEEEKTGTEEGESEKTGMEEETNE